MPLRTLPLSTLAALALAATGLWWMPGAAPRAALDRTPFVAPELRYHTLGEVDALLDAWCAADPLRVERVHLPASTGGLVPPALAFGARGPAPLAERSTVLLVGALDGRSRAGAEAALQSAHTLLSALDVLRSDLAIVVVPWGSPDGLARASAGQSTDGRDATPVDDDEDGRTGEDPPDDLDSDGETRELLLEDPDGPWTFGSDRRFLVPAAEGDSPRLVRVPEGRDDDGDGRFNEDGPGGIQLDAHFPNGWTGPGSDGSAGRFPLEVPLARALADLVLERRVALALVFQGAHGGVARPGGTLAADLAAARDRETYEALARTFTRATGRPVAAVPSLRDARGAEARGAFIDWLHGSAGAIALEVAPWGPEVAWRDGRALQGPPRGARSGPTLSEAQRRWARWLDDERGGLDFADWRPIELGIGRRAWVGGWRARVDQDPPESQLGAALEGLGAFARATVDALPRLDIELLGVERAGDVVRLSARVVNRGLFSTGRAAEGFGASRDGRVHCMFEAPCASALLAGPHATELGVLAGGQAGPVREWLVLAPPGTVLALHARCDAIGAVRREVRP